MSSQPEALIPINVWLSGRSYRIRVSPDDEGRVRRAVKQADGQIMELRRHYAGKDDQDFVAMCLLMYATDRNRAADAENEAEMQALLTALDKALMK